MLRPNTFGPDDVPRIIEGYLDESLAIMKQLEVRI